MRVDVWLPLGRLGCAIVLAAMVVGACGGSSDPGFMSEAQKNQERDAEMQTLAWPSGEPMPTFLAPPASQGKTQYQTGLGKTEADQAWFCAWSKVWLDSRKDKATADAALSRIGGIVNMEIWTTLGGGQQSLSDAIDRAKLGDPTGITSWRDSFQCDG
jgi:hypothetical protein